MVRALSFTYLLLVAAVSATLRINEVDVDQPGNPDTKEFVEIKNTGEEAVFIGGYKLQSYESSGSPRSEMTITTGATIAPNDYYVICFSDTNTPNCDQSGMASDFLSNAGGAGVELLTDGDVSVDSLQWGGTTLRFYARGFTTARDGSSLTDAGLSRCIDGYSTGNNNRDFISASITPGATNNCPCPSSCALQLQSAEETALLAFKDSISASFLTTWEEESQCWEDVTCTDDGSVLSIDINGRMVDGGASDFSNSASLEALPSLTILQLSVMGLIGNLPSWIPPMTNLITLDLSGNVLTGTVFSLCPLINLRELNLGNNNFSGEIPYCLGCMEQMTYLTLSENRFTGRIPYNLQYTSAVSVLLNDNQLYGAISRLLHEFYYDSNSDVILDVSKNYLTNNIIIPDLSVVQGMDIGNNCFFGISLQKSPSACGEFYDGIDDPQLEFKEYKC